MEAARARLRLERWANGGRAPAQLLHVARVHPETARRLLDEDHAARRELCDTSGDDGGNDLEDKEDLVDEDLAVKGLDKGLEAPSGAVLLFKTTEKTLLENENPPATACSLVLDENVPERTIVEEAAAMHLDLDDLVFGKAMKSLLSDLEELTIDSLAECTAGFVAGDFALLARSWDPQRESVETMLVRAASTRPRALASAGDIQEAQRAANALPELAGYKEVRERLRQLIQWQWLQPDSSRRLGAQSPTGILLHGPSGCGKTLLAHKLGQMAACNFVSVKSSDLVSKYVGESERLIRDLFARARRAAPCILFFDELDSIATRRDLGTGGLQQTSAASNRVLGTFLNELDGIDTQQGLLVLGACSRADALDAALLRPGRLGTAVHVPLPNEEDRRAIFHTMRTPWAPGVDLDLLAQELEGYSCAEVRAVNTEAVLAAMRASSNPGDPLALEVTRKHIEFALERVQALRA
ncbi:26S proteasome regulatory subunit 8-like [Hondaea fermentalgiana]|uniref:26S proteasome regulatory subunit 8-like n=1 Tax=Hondaea fermentalgiana TaxID=2315210 RepID=A0A2R5GL30_9STRA|nr:26S proteasome regulatory subunit 8-like [Hondaea fermentalgiana]|eukprot:GBG31580.1 26S proteasome regulatory subunit 8-like [Hondaea fermentalgiana]